MAKCDIIIPVYNAPEYVNFCVFALFHNTNMKNIGKVYLLDDCSNEITHSLLDNLKSKYGKQVVVIHNEKNLGFIKNVNHGFELSKEKYVLLLNTDCFVAKHTVEKLMEHMEKDSKIGLICPVCSNAANLTLEMYPGYSYMMMDQLLEKHFKGQNYDACTVVGNCLMISRKCINEVGGLDEIYGMGYGDETDYQFKAMEKGFTAKVAIDTYVFHKAEMSFNTTNQKRSERLEKNRQIFFSRWGEQYNALLAEYQKNDPIEYIKSTLKKKDILPNFDFVFILPQMGKGAGGIIVVSELVNYLNVLGLTVGMLNLYPGAYNGIMTFASLTPKEISSLKSKYLIATIYDSVFLAKKLASKINSKIVYFSQGYEFLFDFGTRYGEVESSFKIADHVMTISHYLQSNYKNMFHIESLLSLNGIDYDIIYHERTSKKKSCRKKIVMNLRSEALKGGFILNDIIKWITLQCDNVEIHVIDNSSKSDFGVNNNDSVDLIIHKGPIDRIAIYELLRDADILVDSSFSEGFGLLPLEAMAAGVVPVISNSLGCKEYAQDGINSFIIDAVNDSSQYIDKINLLLNDSTLLETMRKSAVETASHFDFSDSIQQYYHNLKSILDEKVAPINYPLTERDQEELEKHLITDVQYEKILFTCKRNYYDANKQEGKSGRAHNLYVLAKEFVKANVYIAKKTVKSILDKDYKL